jgi:hypothetical protein
MSAEKGKKAAFQRELAKVEVIAGLRHAIDARYRRLIQAAQADWERLFGRDPSDACVTVRISAEQLAAQTRAVRGSGFLKSRRSPETKHGAKRALPGFAH